MTTTICAWCQFPLIHSWVRVGNTWICAECLDEVASLIEPYMMKEQNHEEVITELYGPTAQVSDMATDNSLSHRDSNDRDSDRRTDPVT